MDWDLCVWLHLLAHQSQPHDHKSKTSERQGVWALQTKPVVLQGLGQEVSDQLPFPSPGQLRLQLKKPGVPLASGRQSMHHAVTHHLNHHHRVTFTDFAEQLLAVRSCYPHRHVRHRGLCCWAACCVRHGRQQQGRCIVSAGPPSALIRHWDPCLA